MWQAGKKKDRFGRDEDIVPFFSQFALIVIIPVKEKLMQLFIVTLIMLGILLEGNLLSAQTEELYFFEAEEILVATASRKEQPIAESASTIHVITARDIKNSGANTLADLLRSVPGVGVRTWLAEYSNINFRGMLGAEVTNTRILWLVNGMRISDVRDGGVWQDITFPLDLIQRIEIILGPGSALYGANAFQGVINIFTKKPVDLPKYGELNISYGSFETMKLSYAAGFVSGDWQFLVNASSNQTDGPELLPNDRTIRQDYAPHSDRSWYHGHGEIHFKKFLTMSFGHKKAFTDFSGAEFFPNELYRWDRTESFINGVFSKEVNDMKVHFEMEYRRFLEEFFDYSDEPGLDNTVDQNKTEFNLHVLYPMVEWNELMVGAGYRRENIDADEFRPGYQEHTINNPSFFVQDELKLGQFVINAGFRFDTHERYDDQINPRLSMIWNFTEQMRLRASYGRAFKEPANWQLYILQIDAEGNPKLKPEKLDTYELSCAYGKGRRLLFRIDTFYTEMRNLILNNWVVSDDTEQFPFGGRFNPRQVGDALFWGVETQFRGQISRYVECYLNYSYLNAEDEDGDALQYDAEHRANIGISYLLPRLHFSTALHYVGETIDTSGESNPEVGIQDVDDYFIWEATLSYNFFKGMTCNLSGWNIGGATHYEMLGVPAPGPTYMLTLRYPF